MSDSGRKTSSQDVREGVANAATSAKARLEAAADRVGDAAYRAADATATGAHRAAAKAGEWSERGTDLASATRQRADAVADSLRELVRDKPVQSVALALAAGWVAAHLLGRRH